MHNGENYRMPAADASHICYLDLLWSIPIQSGVLPCSGSLEMSQNEYPRVIFLQVFESESKNDAPVKTYRSVSGCLCCDWYAHLLWLKKCRHLITDRVKLLAVFDLCHRNAAQEGLILWTVKSIAFKLNWLW